MDIDYDYILQENERGYHFVGEYVDSMNIQDMIVHYDKENNLLWEDVVWSNDLIEPFILYKCTPKDIDAFGSNDGISEYLKLKYNYPSDFDKPGYDEYTIDLVNEFEGKWVDKKDKENYMELKGEDDNYEYHFPYLNIDEYNSDSVYWNMTSFGNSTFLSSFKT